MPLPRGYLSASQVNEYNDCGLSYKFNYVDGKRPDFIPDSLVFGTSIHAALEYLFRCKQYGHDHSLESLLASFEDSWSAETKPAPGIKYREGDDYNTLLEKGKAMLTEYWNSAPKDDFTVIGVEEQFKFEIPELDVPIFGKIDLIQEDEQGTIVITDFKTSSKAYSQDDILSDFQLTLYNMAIKSLGYEDREILVKFDVLLKTKKPRFEQYYISKTDIDEKRAIKKMVQVYNGIWKEVFVPNNTSWKCKGCMFKSHCDEWFGR